MTVSPNDTSPTSSLTPIRWQLRRAATAVICALMGVATAASGSNNGTPFITGETLGTPVALAANTSYYVLSQEIVGGDWWYGSSTALTTTSVATINNAEYFDGTSYHMTGSTGAHSQGPVSFSYTTTTAPFDHAAV